MQGYTFKMKLVDLNTWGGRGGKERLLSFFENQRENTDVFCLQEIWSAPYPNHEGGIAGGEEINHSKIMVNGLQEITNVLEDFVPYFRPHHGDNYGLLTLVKNNIEVIHEGETFVHKYKGFVPEGDIGRHARNIQHLHLKINGKALTIINFHGLWNGNGKGDSEDRIDQSKNILQYTQKVKGGLILCGDFNLLPDTESLKMLEKSGLNNLIREYGVTSTRTSLYVKRANPPMFADYVLCSPEIRVQDFKVLPDEVSDHSPLCLEFEVLG